MHDRDDDADVADWEDPDPADVDDADDDDPEVVSCPYCGEPVSEAAELCPHCRSYIVPEDAPRRRAWWVVAGVVACVLIVLLAWTR